MSLRPATNDDAEWVLVLRNDPAVRKASLQSERISQAKHRAWFTHHAHQILIFLHNSDRAGLVRLSPMHKGSCWLHFSLAKHYRGIGLGSALVQLGLVNAWAMGNYAIRAAVRQENLASIRCLQKNGFHFKARRGGILDYEWRTAWLT